MRTHPQPIEQEEMTQKPATDKNKLYNWSTVNTKAEEVKLQIYEVQRDALQDPIFNSVHFISLMGSNAFISIPFMFSFTNQILLINI